LSILFALNIKRIDKIVTDRRWLKRLLTFRAFCLKDVTIELFNRRRFFANRTGIWFIVENERKLFALFFNPLCLVMLIMIYFLLMKII
jgi:hypothetical protein